MFSSNVDSILQIDTSLENVPYLLPTTVGTLKLVQKKNTKNLINIRE